MARVSIRDIADMKVRGEKVPMITVLRLHLRTTCGQRWYPDGAGRR